MAYSDIQLREIQRLVDELHLQLPPIVNSAVQLFRGLFSVLALFEFCENGANLGPKSLLSLGHDLDSGESGEALQLFFHVFHQFLVLLLTQRNFSVVGIRNLDDPRRSECF